MQIAAWCGFAAGAVLLLTASSVVKTLLIPRSISSGLLATLVARTVFVVYFGPATARIEDLNRRERMLAAGAPTYLVALLIAYLPVLYAAFNRRETRPAGGTGRRAG